jgi:hypothetical protein
MIGAVFSMASVTGSLLGGVLAENIVDPVLVRHIRD